MAQPGYGQDVRELADGSSFTVQHIEFSDHGEPRVSRSSAGASGEGRDDVHHFPRHTSETRQLYGEMFSELGLPKLRSMSVGPSLPGLRAAASEVRPVSPVPAAAAQLHAEAKEKKKGITARPVSPASASNGGSHHHHNGHLHHPHHHPQHPHNLAGQSVLTVDMFSKEQLNAIFNLAQTFRLCVHKERTLEHILKVTRLPPQFLFFLSISSLEISWCWHF